MTTAHAIYLYWSGIACIAGIVIAYTLLIARLGDLVQPTRLRMADLGMSLLSSDISEDDKAVVQFMLANCFSGSLVSHMMWALPAALLKRILLKLFNPRRIEPSGPPSIECAKLAGYFQFSIFAANPIAASIVVFELVTIGFVGFLVGGQMLFLRAVIAAQGTNPLRSRGYFGSRRGLAT